MRTNQTLKNLGIGVLTTLGLGLGAIGCSRMEGRIVDTNFTSAHAYHAEQGVTGTYVIRSGDNTYGIFVLPERKGKFEVGDSVRCSYSFPDQSDITPLSGLSIPKDVSSDQVRNEIFNNIWHGPSVRAYTATKIVEVTGE